MVHVGWFTLKLRGILGQAICLKHQVTSVSSEDKESVNSVSSADEAYGRGSAWRFGLLGRQLFFFGGGGGTCRKAHLSSRWAGSVVGPQPRTFDAQIA